jgi:hypothetical protein
VTGAKQRNAGLRRTGRREAGTLLLCAGPFLYWPSREPVSDRRPSPMWVMSVVLCNERRPVDFRYAPLALIKQLANN